jgi:hypothetical protein
MSETTLDLSMQIVQRVLDSQIETREDIHEVKASIGRLESGVASLQSFLAEQSVRLDRFSDRPARVERRLELTESSFGQQGAACSAGPILRAGFPVMHADETSQLVGCWHPSSRVWGRTGDLKVRGKTEPGLDRVQGARCKACW